jgi:hypothetical protein
MKSSYELAMERLNKSIPTRKVAKSEKKQLAELDSKFAAKIAEREITSQNEIAKVKAAGDFDKVEALQQRLVTERKSLKIDLEEKKQLLRG